MTDVKFYPAGYCEVRHVANSRKATTTANTTGPDDSSDLSITKNAEWRNSTTIHDANGLHAERTGAEFMPDVNGLRGRPVPNQCRCQSCVLFAHFSKKAADNRMLESIYRDSVDHWKTRNEFYLHADNDRLYANDPRNVCSKVKTKQMKVNDTIVLRKPEDSCVAEYVETIESLYLLPAVRKALQDLRLEQMRPIQLYCWPHVLRFENVAIVGRPESGKTLAYLVPVMCSVFDRIETEADKQSGLFPYGFLSTTKSNASDTHAVAQLRPTVLIVCASTTHVFRLLKQLTVFKQLKTTAMAYLVAPVRSHHTPGYLQQRNAAAIVIATIEAIAEALSDQSLDLSALRTCVFESWHSFSPLQIQTCETVLETVHRHETDLDMYLQFVATAELWSPRFHDFMHKHTHGKLVECYESAIEACAATGTRFQFCVCDAPDVKRHKVVELLKKCTENDRIVIVADEETVPELEQLRDFFVELEVACDALVDESNVHTMSKHNVQLVRELWKRRQPQRRILLCTDRVFRMLMIRTATVLVHYSMPGLWSTFEHRHTALGHCATNALASNVYTILRPNDFHDIYALATFCRRFGTKRSREKLAKLAKSARRAAEAHKRDRNYASCASTLEFGVCVARSYHSDCKRAHRFDTARNVHYSLPDRGPIRYRIVRMCAPNHYFVQFVADSDPDRRFLDRSNEIKRNLDDFKSQYDFEPSALLAETEKNEKDNLAPGQIYGYLIDNDSTLVRVKVISVGHRVVDVLLIDHGFELYNVAARRLITLTSALADMQPTLVEIYIANIQPHATKRTTAAITDYCLHCTFNLQRDLDVFPAQTHHYRSNVLYRYENVLWVDEMNLLQTRNETIEFSIRSFLLDNRIAEENCDLLAAIRTRIETGGGDDDDDAPIDMERADIDVPTSTDAVSTIADDHSDCFSNGGRATVSGSSRHDEYSVPSIDSLAIVTMMNETNGPRKPQIDWTQTDDSVTIRFRLRDPICSLFELDPVTRQSFRFRSSTRASLNEFYELEANLFARVDDRRRNERLDAHNDLIEIELFKIEAGVHWPRLIDDIGHTQADVKVTRPTTNDELLSNGHRDMVDGSVLGGCVPDEYVDDNANDSDYTDSVFSDDD